MQESKSCALPLGDSPLLRASLVLCQSPQSNDDLPVITGWVKGLEPSTSRSTIWRANQLHHTHHINFSLTAEKLMSAGKQACLEGFEPPTHGLEGRCSILLSYKHSRGHEASSLHPSKGKRVMGIEPTYLAWKASVLPLNYTRKLSGTNRGDRIRTCDLLVPNQAL